MRIVAILASHLAFRYRHVRLLTELGTLLLVASLAGLSNAGFLHQAVGRETCHRVVTVGAGEFVLLVYGARPMHTLAALVAVETLCILLIDWRIPLLGETDDLGFVLGVSDMQGTRSVTSLANGFFCFIARIQAEHLGVLGVAEKSLFGIVTLTAALFTNDPGVSHWINIGQSPPGRQQAE